MPTIKTDDGVELYYEESGSGTPVIFVHEFAGDTRSWEPQMRHFSRRYRAIAYNARGYPPSQIPGNANDYNQTLYCLSEFDQTRHFFVVFVVYHFIIFFKRKQTKRNVLSSKVLLIDRL